MQRRILEFIVGVGVGVYWWVSGGIGACRGDAQCGLFAIRRFDCGKINTLLGYVVLNRVIFVQAADLC
ncbi:MAG: hypothetical protein ACKOA7_05870 [Bacteroidota bacterium]